MVDNRINFFINHLIQISSLTKMIDEKILPILSSHFRTTFEDGLQKKNREIINRFNNRNDLNNSAFLDLVLSSFIYECSASPKHDNQSVLFTKYEYLDDAAIKSTITNNYRTDWNDFESEITSLKRIYTEYNLKDDSAIIVTAIPEEFKSIIRKSDFVLTVSDIEQIEKVLDPNSDKETLNKRDNIWANCLFFRKNKWIKVIVLLPNEYAATSVASYLPVFKTNYNFYKPKELLLVGIAGHLDKRKIVKIGHLVISNGFYNAYDLQFIQVNNKQELNYRNNVPIKLNEDYNYNGFDWFNWQPQTKLFSTPTIYDQTIESEVIITHIGKFVSIPGKNKQNKNKKTLTDIFDNALAVEMEGYGCYKFKETYPHLELRIIKAICDGADKNASNKDWQPYCADIAAEFSIDYLIAKYGKDITGAL